MKFKKLRIVAIFLFVVTFFVNCNFVSYGAKRNKTSHGRRISRGFRGKNVKHHKKNTSLKSGCRRSRGRNVRYHSKNTNTKSRSTHKRNFDVKYIKLPVSKDVQRIDEEKTKSNQIVKCIQFAIPKDIQNKDEKQEEKFNDSKEIESSKKDGASRNDVKDKKTDDLQSIGKLELSVWLTTVCNLDWPEGGKWDADEQKRRMCEILDDIKAKGISRVFFQVRTRGDTFYKSDLFPWSEFLTGKIGKAPDYDPLQFVSEECKKRGIKLEAWMNPFLIGAAYTKEEYINSLPDSSELKSHSEWIIEVGKRKFLRIENSKVRNMIVKEAAYIIDHYGYISGIHIDDYFYPYPRWDGSVFTEVYYDDAKEYEAYKKDCDDSSCLSLGDWRRDNVNQFVCSLGATCRSKGKTLSVSPFGIWKNVEDPVSGGKTNGLESYYGLYCDSLKWAKEGWVDFLIPQIYWEFGNPAADFGILANWWNDMFVGLKTKLSIGVTAYRIDPNSKDVAWKDSDEIKRQIDLCKKLKNVSGAAFFRYGSLGNVSNVFSSEK